MPDRSELEAKTRYDPCEVEPRIVQVWLDSGLFHPEPEGDPAENYSIAIPLPNVTGVLHMGHALGASPQLVVARRTSRADEEVDAAVRSVQRED